MTAGDRTEGSRPTSGPPSRPLTQLGPDWVPDADGVPFRHGARVVLVDEADRVLMVCGHDIDKPERRWWFTVGGGVDAGETAREAALREVLEETGLRLEASDLVGPVARRRGEFAFLMQTVRQDEEFFFARVHGSTALSTDGWTAIERAFMDDLRWWHLDELAQVSQEVFPVDLVPLVRELLAGWDGVVRTLVEERA